MAKWIFQCTYKGDEIEKVHKNTFYGVIIDDNINWKPHIKGSIDNNLKKKIQNIVYKIIHSQKIDKSAEWKSVFSWKKKYWGEIIM